MGYGSKVEIMKDKFREGVW